MGYVERKRWIFFGLPFTFTKYTIEESMLTINRGFLKTVEDACYMYKIQDVKLETGLFERLFRLGTVVCFTGDVTDKKIELIHIKKSKEIKNYILEKSEEDRRRRRTLNTLDIGTDEGNNIEDDNL